MEQKNWDKPGNGRLFENNKKATDKQPDYVGSYMTERGYAAGEIIKFGMWRKQTKAGRDYFNLREDNFVPNAEYKKEDREVAYKYRSRSDEDVPF